VEGEKGGARGSVGVCESGGGGVNHGGGNGE
jgi:hypothetical protein